MFSSCDSSASSDLEHRLLWHRHLWRKQDPILGLLFLFWVYLVLPDVRFCLCIFFSSRAQDRQVWIPEHIKFGDMQFSSAATGDFNSDHPVKPFSNIHMTAKKKKRQFCNLAGI